MKVLLLVCFALVLAEFTAYACNCSHCPRGGVCVGPKGMSAKFCVCITDSPMGRRSLKKQLSRKKYAHARSKLPLNLRKKMKKANHYSNKKRRVNI